jgi:hypothetical protein
MTAVWLSLWLGLPRPVPLAPAADDPRWKLPELHDPFGVDDHPAPLPPENELKLRDLKPLPVDRDR